MLTKCKDVRRLDAKKSINKPFENVSCQRRIQIFFRKGASNFDIFSSVLFSGRINLKQNEEPKRL